MTENAVIMGIDPGVKTGIALYQGGKLCELRTIAPVDYERVLLDIQPVLVVVEDSRPIKALFTGIRLSHKAQVKVARNVGAIDCLCSIIFALCARHEIEIEALSPKEKGPKLDAVTFCRKTGYTGKSNEHGRDAGMVAWRFRHRRAKG